MLPQQPSIWPGCWKPHSNLFSQQKWVTGLKHVAPITSSWQQLSVGGQVWFAHTVGGGAVEPVVVVGGGAVEPVVVVGGGGTVVPGKQQLRSVISQMAVRLQQNWDVGVKH